MQVLALATTRNVDSGTLKCLTEFLQGSYQRSGRQPEAESYHEGWYCDCKGRICTERKNLLRFGKLVHSGVICGTQVRNR